MEATQIGKHAIEGLASMCQPCSWIKICELPQAASSTYQYLYLVH
jgi:hypothetical protein